MSLQKQAEWRQQAGKTAMSAMGREGAGLDLASPAPPAGPLQPEDRCTSVTSNGGDAVATFTQRPSLEGVLDDLGVDDLIARLQLGGTQSSVPRKTVLPPAESLWSDDEDMPACALATRTASEALVAPQHTLPGSSAAAGERLAPEARLACRRNVDGRLHALRAFRGQRPDFAEAAGGSSSSSDDDDDDAGVSAYSAQRRAMKAGAAM